jgi:hypothetical protein
MLSQTPVRSCTKLSGSQHEQTLNNIQAVKHGSNYHCHDNGKAVNIPNANARRTYCIFAICAQLCLLCEVSNMTQTDTFMQVWASGVGTAGCCEMLQESERRETPAGSG